MVCQLPGQVRYSRPDYHGPERVVLRVTRLAELDGIDRGESLLEHLDGGQVNDTVQRDRWHDVNK